ncbi:hypothetical protein BGW36DRAFT_289176 [Talaromyces proteolyticus]|uniref:RFX-type winged-helix domain-containing protein n=1 Tax=Talaromyces proteolyticus TaxID=1131652 RepID=A0AAD4KYH6_9EURO|nr:uncharacterized protein BGW36DRAFT_289176 [Talaromyces proteolyticus]KAH8702580.1 hypothetical protein BGW36DRAFT_289176 [Talaromyces proteolyticus]
MPPDIGEGWESHFSMNRVHSQGSSVMSHTQPHSRPGTADPLRSRSNTAVSKGPRRPRSRGSTASIHSSTTQQTQEHMGDNFSPFIAPQTGPGNNMFNSNPEDMIMRFGQQLAHSNSGGSLEVAMHDTHGNVMPRPEDYHGLPNSVPEMVPHGLHNLPVNHYGHLYDTSALDTQMSERTGDENENSEAGSRKKRGSTSTVANDNELRKLLRQYEGFTLKQMAAEVQKHEGAGGKSEKVKQVFAMVWLKENCRKNSGSVRRDRVYCCYAERCGSEHVSVLNPASFGKLVRIIFPNVQTRRLGVRGESKYHYVDLTVIEEKQQPIASQNPQYQSLNGQINRDGSLDSSIRPRSVSISQPPADTAVFPSPTTSFTPKFLVVPTSAGCICDSEAQSKADAIITLENVAKQSGRMMHQMLSFPSSTTPPVDNESLRLPDIASYLPANADSKVADALAALYRTHCISVIDSFRFCKERNLFRYFSAFHGTLTVPVQKLLIHPNLAPWIKECDWLMYQKMIEFLAPLTTQVVPQPVLDAFGSISRRLANHISDTFKSQPVHVSLARLAPAHVFCNLLKHMLDVNQAANAAAAWLCHPDNRNQMWLDFATFVDPKEMILKANIPFCSEDTTEKILKYDVRALLTPLDNPTSPSVPSSYQQAGGDMNTEKHAVQSSTGEEYNFPDKWISFILNLSSLFPNHPAQCVVEKVDRLWDCVLHRLTLAGAQSFSAWWITKVFFHEMLMWQVEKGGFMKHTPGSLQISLETSDSKPQHHAPRQGSFSVPVKDESFSLSENQHTNSHSRISGSSTYGQSLETNLDARPTNEVSALSESMTSLHPTHHDDSAIGLEEDSMLMTGKYDIMADATDANGDVVVI